MKIAADANVLLSAVIGGRAKLVLSHSEVEEILTTEATLAEVQEYAGQIAARRGIPLSLILLSTATLPVTVVDRMAYAPSMAEAQGKIEKRDPDDVELLALALQFDVPVWSNDSDFEGTGVTWYTTATLLAKLDRADKN